MKTPVLNTPRLKDYYTYKACAVDGGVDLTSATEITAHLKMKVPVYAIAHKGAVIEVTKDNWREFLDYR
jgi:hypothetical protein